MEDNKDKIVGVRTVTCKGKDYKIYGVMIGGVVYDVAEKKLNELINKAIEENCYDYVKHIDRLYGYYLPKNKMTDEEIIESIKDIVE